VASTGRIGGSASSRCAPSYPYRVVSAAVSHRQRVVVGAVLGIAMVARRLGVAVSGSSAYFAGVARRLLVLSPGPACAYLAKSVIDRPQHRCHHWRRSLHRYWFARVLGVAVSGLLAHFAWGQGSSSRLLLHSGVSGASAWRRPGLQHQQCFLPIVSVTGPGYSSSGRASSPAASSTVVGLGGVHQFRFSVRQLASPAVPTRAGAVPVFEVVSWLLAAAVARWHVSPAWASWALATPSFSIAPTHAE